MSADDADALRPDGTAPGPADPTPSGSRPIDRDPSPTTDPAAAPARDDEAGGPRRATGSKTSAAFVFSALGALILLLLLIFILQNLKRVPIEFLGFKGTIPVGVALLLAAVAGALLVGIAGGLRILQLRRRADSWRR